MSREIVFVAGSPSLTSRSSHVARVVESQAKHEGFRTKTFSVHDFEASELLLGRADAPSIRAFVDAVRASSAIVFSSPVYKATYAGALKTIVDLIPPDALASRPALGIATTRLAAHGSEVTRAYLALFAFFGVGANGTLVVLDDELRVENGEGTFADAAKERVFAAARTLLEAASRD
jgi:FMN reductase